ncbi:hypothetical protein KJ813_05860 [bacterium]|nr:hypothetical protein [bacterium]MBU4362168.1 hypothetical protein [bacterium]MBU4603015.1 hypothetical protein [bacterium]
MRNYKEIPLWANISPEEWNDWKWQLDNRIMSVCRDYSHRYCCSGKFTPEDNTRVSRNAKKISAFVY